MPTSEITLTSKLGQFTFEENVPLSRAKLIRDSITGQYFNPKPGDLKLRTLNDCQEYARNHLSNTLAAIPFGLSSELLAG